MEMKASPSGMDLLKLGFLKNDWGVFSCEKQVFQTPNVEIGHSIE